MKKVVLIFTDVTSLADFLLTYKPSNTDANTSQCSLTGELTDDLIVIACKQYDAQLKPTHSFTTLYDE